MKTRTASLSDLPHAAELCSKAFYDDELYSKMFPHKAQFPDDYLRGFERKFRSRMLQRNVVVFLAETEPGDVPGDLEDKGYGGMGWDSAGGQTAGVAVWMRDGHDGGRDVNPWAGVQLDLQRRLSELAAWSMGWVWPDRSADVEAAAFAQKAFDAVDLLFPETEGGRWHLKFLGIHPAWQRRGVGRLLCERGMEEARKEKLPAMLEASPVGEGLYASLGFRVIGELVVKELGVRGPVMRWDPPV